MSRFEELNTLVEQWASDRGIIAFSSPSAQLLKTVSELGELADATIKLDSHEIVDGIGDVLVTLIIYAKMQGLTLTECLEAAYAEIKDRRGQLLPTGVFAKEVSDA